MLNVNFTLFFKAFQIDEIQEASMEDFGIK